MKSLALALLFLGAGCANHVAPRTLEKWHDIFTWHNPENWDHHEDKLNDLCDSLFENHVGEPKSEHIREVRICCEKVTGEERRECVANMQRSYLNYCCNDFLMRQDNACCRKSGSERYSCLYSSPPSNAVCTPSYTFNRRFRAVHKPTIDRIDRVDSFSEEEMPFESWRDESESSSSEADGVSFSGEDSDSASASEEASIAAIEELTPEALSGKMGESGMRCMRRLPFPDLEPFHSAGLAEEELTGATGDQCCGPCCKAGAIEGKHRLRPHECPYLQCRSLWVQFYRQHRRLIKHPYCCGFGFVACCERQHHKDMYTLSTLGGVGVDSGAVDVEIEEDDTLFSSP